MGQTGWRYQSLIISVAALFLAALILQSAYADGPGPVSALKGVCLSGGYTDLGQVTQLHVTYALNWGVSLGTARRLKELGIEYHPRLLLDKPELLPTNDSFRIKAEALAAEFPGTAWLFYNEPELNCQHPVSPRRAVELFDKMREIISAIDPTARFVVGNTTFECWVNPEGKYGGEAWLKKFVQFYRDAHAGEYPPVLGYGLHLYADCCAWGEDGEGYLDYLDRAGRFIQSLHPGAEMWCTEWGALHPGERPIERVIEVGSFWFETHGVPYFLYATNADNPEWCPDCSITLMEKGILTPFGEYFAKLPGQTFTQFVPYVGPPIP